MSNAQSAKVCDLIDPVQRSWDLEQPKLHFLPLGWELIEKIPLLLNIKLDFWAWHYEKIRSILSQVSLPDACTHSRTDWIEHNARRSFIEANQNEWAELWDIKVLSKL
jgi:hypothetical protein